MAGIYIHIPFCKQACHYCDFHFSTSMNKRGELIDAIAHEAEMKAVANRSAEITSLYFGGGTPSLLSKAELDALLRIFRRDYNLSENLELTLEANPDDLNKEKLEVLAEAGVNRLSVGIQSFEDKYLKWMNRAHNASEALNCVKFAGEVGIKNISIDLIYGLPEMTETEWEAQLRQAVDLGVQHISAYCLTVEPQTALGHRVKKGTEKPIDDAAALNQFRFMVDFLAENDFEQYEVSNFSRPGYHSQHNTSYWKGIPYIPFGPSAHGFDGTSRYWNIANNIKYLESIRNNEIPETREILSLQDRFNEWLMTGLRTIWGIDLEKGKVDFGIDLMNDNKDYLNELLGEGLAEIKGSTLILTKKGLFMADGIASNLFAVNDD